MNVRGNQPYLYLGCTFAQLHPEKRSHIRKLLDTKYRNTSNEQELIDLVLEQTGKPQKIEDELDINIRLIKDIIRITRKNIIANAIVNARLTLAI